jgi:hypothetical protein
MLDQDCKSDTALIVSEVGMLLEGNLLLGNYLANYIYPAHDM